MQIYHFKRLIDKYSVSCKLVTLNAGKWVAGEWETGETLTEEIKGAVVPISEKRIQNNGGSYKQGDCEFITTQKVDTNKEVYIIHNDKKYKLEDSTDYSDYADFNIYVARRVSAFDTTSKDTKNNP